MSFESLIISTACATRRGAARTCTTPLPHCRVAPRRSRPRNPSRPASRLSGPIRKPADPQAERADPQAGPDDALRLEMRRRASRAASRARPRPQRARGARVCSPRRAASATAFCFALRFRAPFLRSVFALRFRSPLRLSGKTLWSECAPFSLSALAVRKDTVVRFAERHCGPSRAVSPSG